MSQYFDMSQPITGEELRRAAWASLPREVYAAEYELETAKNNSDPKTSRNVDELNAEYFRRASNKLAYAEPSKILSIIMGIISYAALIVFTIVFFKEFTLTFGTIFIACIIAGFFIIRKFDIKIGCYIYFIIFPVTVTVIMLLSLNEFPVYQWMPFISPIAAVIFALLIHLVQIIIIACCSKAAKEKLNMLEGSTEYLEALELARSRDEEENRKAQEEAQIKIAELSRALEKAKQQHEYYKPLYEQLKVLAENIYVMHREAHQSKDKIIEFLCSDISIWGEKKIPSEHIKFSAQRVLERMEHFEESIRLADEVAKEFSDLLTRR